MNWENFKSAVKAEYEYRKGWLPIYIGVPIVVGALIFFSSFVGK